MSLKKQFLKNKPVCKVTFNLPKEEAKAAGTVNLVGDFNNWDTSAAPMKKFKNGKFTITVDLKTGREYQFRYLMDGKRWENDQNADKYIPVPELSAENSVVVV
jgi:1,4-alpha-glucan branching enzyme